ncbi:hypothetical protein AAFC00_006328 [Neodothiora populina]|uniref:Uncharacterized protein n=1 Tax=Neodothiora populina TaxID=2781224 RepID=A0ABR3P4U5_9PEZI
MNMFRSTLSRRVLSAAPSTSSISLSTTSSARAATASLFAPRQITPAAGRRTFSQRTTLLARKDTQDKDSLKPEPNEYSKSGSDDAAAAVDKTAFDPDITSPEAEHDSAGQEAKQDSNPLNVSPANQEVSKPRGSTEGGSQSSSAQSGKGPSDRARTSGGGSPDKAASGQKYSS